VPSNPGDDDGEEIHGVAGLFPGGSDGVIASGMLEGVEIGTQIIGPRAVNQAVKMIAIARRHVAPSDIDLCFAPGFVPPKVGGEERTVIEVALEARHPL